MTQNKIKFDSHKIRNITEVDEGYKLISPSLLACYSGIHPDSLSKIGHIIFENVIMHNKMHVRKDDKNYREEEAKRIFSSILFQPRDLAQSIHPVKYSNGGNVDHDVSNIIKRLDELEENNIFYVWKFKQPHTYIYIMERYIYSWKYYNSKGVLTIKSIRKIISRTRALIDTMSSLETQRGRTPIKEEIVDSFGFFLNRLLEKMNPKVACKLTRFEKGSDIFTYTTNLTGELKGMEADEDVNFDYDDEFLSRLPVAIRNKIIKSHKGEKMNFEMAELVPQNPNIIKVKKSKDNKNRDIAIKILKDDQKVEAEDGSFENDDPFKNPRSFTLFYRANIRMYNSKVRFYDFVSEIMYAAEIMDMLLKFNRNNQKFLKAWIRNYASFVLTGNNMYKEEKTSLKSFNETFDKYNNTYIG